MAPVATPQQIIQSIRARRTPLPLLEPEGCLDRATLAILEKTQTLTITNLTPVYGEGRYGKGPDNGTIRLFTPYAELGAIARLDRTNLNIRLLAPILAQDVIFGFTAGTSGTAPPYRNEDHARRK